ncbi:MAG: 2-succinyl-5-enolpyruvyl-6-hydroxy-3-cyclohexene-1-carboxylate synthase, partial [Lentisphaerae bacterium]|nr:2-succinyl-5-enolpyruvyl-6-hydroxy-3-cyclohexene-1-carboxylate synthase [Lentisphaerota bacterium]
MDRYYTNEKNVLIVIALLKAHNIRKVVASPGGTNVSFVASVQHDPFFQIYSAVDERSAGYIACGLASAAREPVVLSCTGATASRNYMPALTEAFYRKLPILAITSTQNLNRIGMHHAQVLDRRVVPNDIAQLSVTIPSIRDEEDAWGCEVRANQAMLELTRHGGMPVHINLETTFSQDFSVQELPAVRIIRRIRYNNPRPELPNGRIGIYVGAHQEWSKTLFETVESFCKKYNAIVFCDHTSNYRGQYSCFVSRLTSQVEYLA